MSLDNAIMNNYAFLLEMYEDSYFPEELVRKGEDILRELCLQIEQQKPQDLEQLYRLAHAATERFNDLQQEINECDRQIEMLEQVDENTKMKWAIKKRPIMRVTDLTYENIRHISATKLLEVIDRNFGGGWDSLSQSIQDIIESGFDISTTTLPQDRLKKVGGMYDKKINR